MKTTE